MIQVTIADTRTGEHLGAVHYPNLRTPAWAARNARIVWAHKNGRIPADLTAAAWEIDTENRATDTGPLEP